MNEIKMNKKELKDYEQVLLFEQAEKLDLELYELLFNKPRTYLVHLRNKFSGMTLEDIKMVLN